MQGYLVLILTLITHTGIATKINNYTSKEVSIDKSKASSMFPPLPFGSRSAFASNRALDALQLGTRRHAVVRAALESSEVTRRPRVRRRRRRPAQPADM